MKTKVISISLSDTLLEKINELAKLHYQNRSEYIRETIVRRVHAEAPPQAHNPPNIDPVDELVRLMKS